MQKRNAEVISPVETGDQGFAFGNHELFGKNSAKTSIARFARCSPKYWGGHVRKDISMKDLLTPTYMFGSYREVTAEFLLSKGLKALLIDIDNTLAPYEQPDPDDAIRAWFDELHQNGIKTALVSNNHPPRVERFNQTLGLIAFADSKKPSRRALLRAIDAIGARVEETAALGDQLLTDAYGAKHLGIPAIIVPPIRDKKNLFFRFKRWCERPFIRKYARAHGFEEWMTFWKVRERRKRG